MLLGSNIVPGGYKIGYVFSFGLEFTGRFCLTDRGYKTRTVCIRTVIIQFHAHLHTSEHQFRPVHVYRVRKFSEADFQIIHQKGVWLACSLRLQWGLGCRENCLFQFLFIYLFFIDACRQMLHVSDFIFVGREISQDPTNMQRFAKVKVSSRLSTFFLNMWLQKLLGSFCALK